MKLLKIMLAIAVATTLTTAATPADKKQEAPKPEVKMSDIPGITTPDKTPHACVDCHANHPEMKMDFRLSTTLAKWRDGADPEIFEKAKAAAPAGRTLTEKHPDVHALVKVIPDDCFMCHVRDSRVAPPFSKLLHEIHLTGGKDNHFLTMAGGTCTSCHKLDEKTGTWRVGSGEEK
jgi:hypothetical protein